MRVRFKKMRPEAMIPTFGHDDASNAGLDFYCAEGKTLEPGKDAWIPTGVACEFAFEPHPVSGGRGGVCGITYASEYPGWKPCLMVRPRSSMAKLGLEITEGTVDSGYRGEIMVHVRNVGDAAVEIHLGDRIAQGVVMLIPDIKVEEIDDLSESRRGARGFGSSGM